MHIEINYCTRHYKFPCNGSFPLPDSDSDSDSDTDSCTMQILWERDRELNQYYAKPFKPQWEWDRDWELMHIEINYCTRHHKFPCNGSFPLPDSDSDSDSDTDSCTMQILWERDMNLNLSQWKHVPHNTM